MADSNKHTPLLRFPEFLNDEEWAMDSMESIFEIKNGYTPSKSNPDFWTDGTIPWFRMEDIRKNGHILSNSIQHITPGAVKSAGLFPAYSIIVATTATIGEHALIIVDSLANQQFTFLTKRKSFDNRIDMVYFHYFMFIIDEWCKQNTNAGGLLSVNMEAFKKLVIPYPASLSEQRKIAECFSSIDKQIAATKRKLEQLKEHKRGLMQRIFPVKGKTVPELRFPEFQNDGEWEERSFSDIFTFIPNNTLSRANLNNENGSVQNVHYGDVLIRFRECLNVQNEQLPFISDVQDIDRYYKVKLVNGDVIIADTAEDETVGKCTELVGHTNGIIVSGLHTIAIRPNKIFATGYLGFYINSNSYREQLTQIMQGVKVLSISKTAISQTKIHFPSSISEQGKIAHSLSSINDVIKSYEDKITALELHKKGLMQQLFPNLPHHETN